MTDGTQDKSNKKFTPRKLYKIGELMRVTGISRQTLHNYTMLGLITEAERTPSNHRLYPEDVFERLERILALRRAMTLREIVLHLKRDTPLAEPGREGSRALGAEASPMPPDAGRAVAEGDRGGGPAAGAPRPARGGGEARRGR